MGGCFIFVIRKKTSGVKAETDQIGAVLNAIEHFTRNIKETRMRKIELPTVMINSETYPIYCDLYVLSQIQERMDINDFERGIVGAEIIRDENGEPEHDEDGRIKLQFGKYDINALIMGLTLMINEGLLIESEQTGSEQDPVDEKYIGRTCDLPLVELSNVVHNNLIRCMASKKNKTRKTTSRKRNTSK